MTTYRKTATVEAVQWTGDNLDEIRAFLGDDLIGSHEFDGRLIVRTLEGDLSYDPGYWIVRNPAGEHYGCADDVWRDTYVVHDPRLAADAIMVELAGLVDGVDDADDVDKVLSGVAEQIVAKVLGIQPSDTEPPAALDESPAPQWRVGDRFTWKYIESAGPRVILHVGDTHLAYASTAEPGDWGACEIDELNDRSVVRLPVTVSSLAVKHMLDAVKAEHGQTLAGLFAEHPTYG